MTIMVALDLSKAFDTMSFDILLNDINDTNITHLIKRCLFSYLRGRRTYVDFREKTSKNRKMKQGVTQDEVLSPILFNLHIGIKPQPLQRHRSADDCSILATGVKLSDLINKINNYLRTVVSWFNDINLSLTPEKSTSTLFTTWTKEINIDTPIEINGHILITVNHPEIL